ncbi:hypothetical protein BDR06DRAFT_423820 [Suillus hirtellus]|nr:hypothetical protein BDR06DRAFT_423820 [Suillus hirtellus]
MLPVRKNWKKTMGRIETENLNRRHRVQCPFCSSSHAHCCHGVAAHSNWFQIDRPDSIFLHSPALFSFGVVGQECQQRCSIVTASGPNTIVFIIGAGPLPACYISTPEHEPIELAHFRKQWKVETTRTGCCVGRANSSANTIAECTIPLT